MSKSLSPQQKVKKKSTEHVLAKAAEKSQQNVVEQLAKIKVNVAGALDDLANGLSAELTTLKEVQAAIEIEKGKLEELYAIQVEADTLANLKVAQQLHRETFQKEMAQTKAETVDGYAAADLEMNRVEEQYQYDLKIKHRDQEASFNELLAKREDTVNRIHAERNAAVTARENAVAHSENELNGLRMSVATYDERVKKEVDRAVAIATNSLKRDLTHQFELEKMTLNNNLTLALREKERCIEEAEDLEAQITQLQEANKEAVSRVHQIAEKAIEGASKQSLVVNTSADTNERNRK